MDTSQSSTTQRLLGVESTNLGFNFGLVPHGGGIAAAANGDLQLRTEPMMDATPTSPALSCFERTSEFSCRTIHFCEMLGQSLTMKVPPDTPNPGESNPPKQPNLGDQGAEKERTTVEQQATSSGPVQQSRNFLATEWPWVLVSLVSVVSALIAFIFGSIKEERGIAWWHKTLGQAPHELHVRAHETYGCIALRNVSPGMFRNVGVQLQTQHGELDRGLFDPDPRDIVPASENRVMSSIETGPKSAPFVLKNHADRFDPDRTWLFYYSGTDLGEIKPAVNDGVPRTDFLELKGPAMASLSTEAHPIDLHYWNWRDWVWVHHMAIGLIALVVFLIALLVLLRKWMVPKKA